MSGYVSSVYPSGMNADFVPVFDNAAAFWNKAIRSGSAGYTFPSAYSASGCGVDYTFPAGYRLDGLIVFAVVEPIDGVGGTLGSAGACAYLGDYPILGRMRFDSADSTRLNNQGSFEGVIIHEMGHVIGIGGNWNNLVRNPCRVSPCNTNPTYIGANGIEGYSDLGGSGAVPVGDERGPGTWNAHWNEAFFDNELMTGFLNSNSPNPLSIMSVKSLRDLAYTVNLDAAQEYSIPSEFARPLGGEQIELLGEMMRFDFVDIEEDVARQAALGNDEMGGELTGIALLFVIGFLLLGSLITYGNFKQKKMLKEFLTPQHYSPVKAKQIEP